MRVLLPTRKVITTSSYYAYPGNFYRLGSVAANAIHVEEISNKDLLYVNRAPLTNPTINNPVHVRHEGGVVIYPTTGISSINISYVRKPAVPNWVGTSVAGHIIATPANALYKNFELHPSEEHELVVKILAYAGIIIKAADVTQAAAAKDQQITQSER